jgi:para-nitrobenzyl esterase
MMMNFCVKRKAFYNFLCAVCAGMALLFVCACSKSAKKSELVTAAVKNGDISGFVTKGVAVFKGIPFAKPPLGDLRFAPPEDAEPWEGVLDCTEFRSSPLQYPSPVGGISDTGNEDCLYLNVWAPADALPRPDRDAPEKHLPVYVWIYGGAFAVGSGSISKYDGEQFARDGIVTVTFNYRVNALGFFASQETLNRYGTTGNWGLLDQIKALQWVHDNIAAFGGDPGQVTIGGESAGSMSVSGLILSPLAKGLFQSAIMESGSLFGVEKMNSYCGGDLERRIALSGVFASLFHAADDAGGLEKLRSVDADTLIGFTKLENIIQLPLFFSTYPVFDGYVLPRNPWAALDNGNYNHVKLLFGYNTDEGSLFVPKADEYIVKMLVTRLFGYENQQKVLEEFPMEGKGNSPTQAGRDLFKYTILTSGMKQFADVLSMDGLPVFGYHFAFVNLMSRITKLGAHHGAEIEFAFGQPGAGNKALTAGMHSRFAAFIKTGDPNAPGASPRWERYDSQGKNMMRFDRKITAELMPDAGKNDFIIGLMKH